MLLEDVGPWLCKQLKKRLDDRLKQSSVYGDGLTLKYIDPSYMVRGIPPNTADNLYCLQLAQNAVHGGKCFQGNTCLRIPSRSNICFSYQQWQDSAGKKSPRENSGQR